MADFEIRNDYISIGINRRGAELQSIRRLSNEREYINEFGDNGRVIKAPLLFPFVGRLKNGVYRHKENIYQMKTHGFARENDFELIEQEDNRLVFRFESNEETLAVYPFPFVLEVEYILHATRVEIVYNVHNPSDETMYFSIGAHEAVKCPVIEGEAFTDYYLEFDKDELLVRNYLDETGATSSEADIIILENGRLYLDYRYFERDVMIIKKFESEVITLKSAVSPVGVEFRVKDFPFLGIWTRPGSPFICVEPWFGYDDVVKATGELKEKEGIQSLLSGKVFTCSHSLRVF